MTSYKYSLLVSLFLIGCATTQYSIKPIAKRNIIKSIKIKPFKKDLIGKLKIKGRIVGGGLIKFKKSFEIKDIIFGEVTGHKFAKFFIVKCYDAYGNQFYSKDVMLPDKGLFKIKIPEFYISGKINPKVRLIFDEVKDKDIVAFNNGQQINIVLPYEVEYELRISDWNISVTRKDKYLKKEKTDQKWEELQYVDKVIDSDLATITLSDGSFYSEENNKFINWKNKFEPWEAKKWFATGLSPSKAISCRNAGYKSEDIEKMISKNINLLDIETICQELPKGDKNKWKKAGFSWRDALRLKRIFSTVSEILKWKKSGFPVKDAEDWGKIFKLKTAIKWRKKFTLDEAIKFKQLGYGYDEAVRIKKACGGNIGSMYELMASNPYNIPKKCYTFDGNTSQILGKHSALMNNYSFFVFFGKQVAPKFGFTGIVKGGYLYVYKTNFGRTRLVPKLEVVSIIQEY